MEKQTEKAVLMTMGNCSFMVWWCHFGGVEGVWLVFCYGASYLLSLLALLMVSASAQGTLRSAAAIVNGLIVISPVLLMLWGMFLSRNQHGA